MVSECSYIFIIFNFFILRIGICLARKIITNYILKVLITFCITWYVQRAEYIQYSDCSIELQFFIYYITVGSLPYGFDHSGARAVSTGKDVYLTVRRSLYELVCDTKTCNWYHMKQQLDAVGEEVEWEYTGEDETMLLLPNSYSCKSKTSVILV